METNPERFERDSSTTNETLEDVTRHLAEILNLTGQTEAVELLNARVSTQQFIGLLFRNVAWDSLSSLVHQLRANLGDSASKRFGGVIYSFLRGVDASGEQVTGIHYDKPTKLELDALETELSKRDWRRA